MKKLGVISHLLDYYFECVIYQDIENHHRHIGVHSRQVRIQNSKLGAAPRDV